MRKMVWIGLAVVLALGGCQNAQEAGASAGGPRGRFVGVGIYSPGAMWSQLVRPTAAEDPAAATLDDDEQVIVVLDTVTGQIRQCGNLSGHCISLDPQAKTAAPAKVARHLRDLLQDAPQK